MNNHRNKVIRLVVALSISAVFIILVVRGVDYRKVYQFLIASEWIYVAAAFLTIITAQILRSLRWGVMLTPLGSFRQNIVFPITSVGFMLISLLPARIGEFARPYLLYNNTEIKFSSAMATIVLERILDSIFVMIFFGVIISRMHLPHWIVESVIFIISGIFCLIVLLLFGSSKRARNTLKDFTRRVFSERFSLLSESILEKFYEGSAFLGKGTHTLLILFLTGCIWSFLILVNFFLFKAFQIELGTFAALTTLTLTALGISVPAGPGFIGNFDFFCMLALSMFGVEKDLALTYALVSHALILSTFSLLGLISINLSGLQMGFSMSRPHSLSEKATIQ